MDGGADDDMIDGGAGDDQLIGGPGADVLDGGGDADVLKDLEGENDQQGGAGNDALREFRASKRDA